nr:MAG TPA: hypothetical protein [Caudoviricetes sp.]
MWTKSRIQRFTFTVNSFSGRTPNARERRHTVCRVGSR